MKVLIQKSTGQCGTISHIANLLCDDYQCP